MNLGLMKFLLLAFFLPVVDAVNCSGAVGSAGDPPDPNKPFKLKFLDGLDHSPDEEDEELYNEDEVTEILAGMTPGLRICQGAGGCGKLTYLRKDACGNPACQRFYMRRPDTKWVHQKGRSALKSWDADEFEGFLARKHSKWGGSRNWGRKRAINQRWKEDVEKAKAASLVDMYPKTPGVVIAEVDESPNACALVPRVKAMPKMPSRPCPPKPPRFVLKPNPAYQECASNYKI